MSKKTEKTASTPTVPNKPISNVLLVGNKPTMNYVLFTVNQMKDTKEIVIKARGKSIHKAVDVAEILRRRFLQNLKVKNISLGTDEVEDQKTQKPRRISLIYLENEKLRQRNLCMPFWECNFVFL